MDVKIEHTGSSENTVIRNPGKTAELEKLLGMSNSLLKPVQTPHFQNFQNPIMNPYFTPPPRISPFQNDLLPAPTPSRGRKLEIFTKEQVDELNAFFNKNQYPSKAEKEYFAAKFGLEYSQIYGWFGAKRFKYKKQLGMDSHQFQQTMKFIDHNEIQ